MDVYIITLLIIFVVMVYTLYSINYLKVKLHSILIKLQEKGVINKKRDLNKNALFSQIFWFLPVKREKEIKDDEYKETVKKINRNLLLFFIELAMIFFLIRFKW